MYDLMRMSDSRLCGAKSVNAQLGKTGMHIMLIGLKFNDRGLLYAFYHYALIFSNHALVFTIFMLINFCKHALCLPLLYFVNFVNKSYVYKIGAKAPLLLYTHHIHRED